jgi:predicted AlkP superfamily pyrophosphatase or phosphodiesterase
LKKSNYFIIIFIILTLYLQAETPYVLMVSFDGFRYDYMEMADTPNLDHIRDNGVKAESMQPVFPTKTFPNHYSIATGAYAGTHGLMSNSFYSYIFEDYYSMGDPAKVTDPKWYGSEPIWVTAERQGVKAASFFWVGSEAPIKGYLPSIVKQYDHGFPYDARIDSVMAWFQLPEDIRPHLVMLYFDQPDSDGHKLGPENPELIITIEYMDGILGQILTGIKSLPIGEEVNLILVSDHGMATVVEDQTIDISSFLPDPENLWGYSRGPITQLHLRDDSKDKIVETAEALSNISHITTYTYEEIPERFHFKNENSGDLVLVADEGWIISGDGNPYSSAGTHGYDPAVKNMHGIFYAIGPHIRSNYQIGSFENVNVYPLICKLLDIEPYKDAPDAPDGKLEVLEEILKK